MEEKRLISQEEVADYFPKQIWECFGLEENQIRFFGINNQEISELKEGKVKNESKYLTLLYDKNKSKLELSFKNSQNRWIRGEHEEYINLIPNYEGICFKYPLIVIKLISEQVKFEKPFIYTNFTRYADHVEFRNKGIATKVFNSVCDKCKSEGIEYVYLNLRSKMPSTFSGWLKQGEVSKKDLKKISSLFYNKPINKVLPWWDSYLKILKDKK